ncbi:MAG: hypothetical protein ACKV2T_28830 [Kofleriaceae bacterium]
MGDTVLVASAHSDIVYYLRVQGLVSLVVGLLVMAPYVALTILSPSMWRKSKFLMFAPFSLGIGGIFLYLGIRSLAMSTPPLTLSGDVLRVGDQQLALAAPVELAFSGGTPEVPDGPFGDNVYNHLPGGASFPPSFDGGPVLTVKSGARSVELRPYVYGPFRIFGDAASHDATKLMHALATRASDGDAREWLLKMFVEFTGDGRPRKDFGTFLLWAGVSVLGVTALMTVVVINSRRKQARRRMRASKRDQV